MIFTIQVGGDRIPLAMTKKKTNQNEKMYTVSEVAEHVQRPASTVRWWIKQGRFPNAVKRVEQMNTFWLIPARDLTAFSIPKIGRPSKKAKKS
jgi:hypothetical protein